MARDRESEDEFLGKDANGATGVGVNPGEIYLLATEKDQEWPCTRYRDVSPGLSIEFTEEDRLRGPRVSSEGCCLSELQLKLRGGRAAICIECDVLLVFESRIAKDENRLRRR